MTEFRRGTRQFWTPYLFLLPNLIIFIVFVIIPAFQGLAMSFTDWSVFSTPRFVGLANFRELLSDDVFFITFRNTVVYSVLTVVLVVVVSLALALMLYRNTLP
ncbi:MAG: hypothetical protein WCR76_06515, partial [Sphaerochaetaceae bacterium]